MQTSLKSPCAWGPRWTLTTCGQVHNHDHGYDDDEEDEDEDEDEEVANDIYHVTVSRERRLL